MRLARYLRAARPLRPIARPVTQVIPARYSSTAAPAAPAGRRPAAIPTTDISPPPETSPQFEPLERSIKADRRALLLFSIPIPPTSWPSHLELLPLLGDVSYALKKTKIGVNAYWDGVGHEPIPGPRDEEVYPATLVYPDGTRFAFTAFSRDTLKSEEWAKAAEYEPRMDISLAPPNFLPAARGRLEKPEILVCTHGSRDCRCGTTGGALAAALREVVAEHKLNIPIREVGHVGGHKWAANALLVPSLDMLSNLTPVDAPALVEHVANRRPTYSPVWAHWRGRIGLDAGAQARVWANILRHLPRETKFEGPTATVPTAQSEAVRVPLRFRTFAGEEKVVDARVGDSLLEVGKEFDLPAIEGVCGGNLECATCHMYIDPSAPIGPPDEDELDMLGTALGYCDGPSRLGCQIKVTPELAVWAKNGGVIDLPQY